jgi:dethiobiotin synthetase
MKPFCSGGRDDAEQLHALQGAGLSLDEVNPFYFDEPISPYVAALNQKRTVALAETLTAIRTIQSRGFPILIEGAGGLLSPLGERFTFLDIIREFPGNVCIVGNNSLGVINAALLTHRALESIRPPHQQFVLMNPPQADASSVSNARVIADWTGVETHEFPHLPDPRRKTLPPTATKVLDSLLDWWLASRRPI